MSDQSLLDQAERLLAAARKAGADSADAVAVRGNALSVSCRNGELEEVERSEGDDMGLRVFIGKRQAVVSTNRGARADVDELAGRAVAMAREAPEDRTAGLADPALLASGWTLPDIYDAAEPDANDLEDAARACEQAGLAMQGVSNSSGASASFSLGGMALVTTGGFAGAYQGTGYSLSCSMVAGTGTHMERDYHHESRTHLADLPAPEEVGREAGERTVKRLGAKKIPSGTFPVIYDPRVAAGLVAHFLSAVSGAAVARKTSFLKDRMDKQVFAKGIAITDDPLLPRGLRSHPFDGEGVKAERLDLVTDGVLRHWLLDSASARVLGLATNGRARRGVSSSPSPGASNCRLEAGTVGPEEMIESVRRGFYVTDLMGQAFNAVTGDYSRGAAGFWIEDGTIAHPVSEVTIAGNLKDMFARLVPASDLKLNRSINAPTILIEDMAIAGT